MSAYDQLFRGWNRLRVAHGTWSERAVASLEGVAARLADSDNGRRVSSAVDALDEAIKQIRSAIFSLHSRPGPDDGGLRTQILNVVEEAGGVLGLEPTVRLSGSLDEVPADASEHMLGALREAPSNAARHAKAGKINVTVEAGPELILVVRDDGIGITNTGRRSGLGNLAERAAMLGGAMHAGPAEGGGTRLEWRVPLVGSQPAR
jgi:signal transduction histidine kinase